MFWQLSVCLLGWSARLIVVPLNYFWQPEPAARTLHLTAECNYYHSISTTCDEDRAERLFGTVWDDCWGESAYEMELITDNGPFGRNVSQLSCNYCESWTCRGMRAVNNTYLEFSFSKNDPSVWYSLSFSYNNLVTASWSFWKRNTLCPHRSSVCFQQSGSHFAFIT